MRIQFDETTRLAPGAVYDYFKTPSDWPRLFAAFGEVRDRGSGWFAVAMHRSPLPLVARITAAEPSIRVAWDLRGFWRGTAEIRFDPVDSGTHITGYEEVNVPHLLGLGRVLERWAEPRFAAVWESGWRKLRGMVDD